METKKPLPILTSDEDAERFVSSADLSEYDLSGFAPVTFDFHPGVDSNSDDTPPSALPGISPTRGEIG